VLCDAALARECDATANLEEIAARLVQAAITSGSRDNCTALVAKYQPD
jgi:serine/threonine protein phosphatase PrpC